MMQVGVPELLIVLMIVASLLLIVWPAARICKRIGYSPWLGVFAALPLANLALLWFVALSPWPISASANNRL